MLAPGYLPGETGYCVMPDGSGYVAILHKMAGATAEMFDWWFAWHALEDLRYKIWYPEYHISARVDDTDRAKILEPDRPLSHKFQGMTHHVVEDIGGGELNAVDISFLTPEDFGFDMDRFRSPNAEALAAANVQARPVGAPADEPGLPVAFVHLVRSIPEGIEVRNRFWIGYQIVDKKPVSCSSPRDGDPGGGRPGSVPARRAGVRQSGSDPAPALPGARGQGGVTGVAKSTGPGKNVVDGRGGVDR